LRLTGGQDGMRWPAKLIEKLTHIASQIEDSDFAPTAQQIAVNQLFTEQIHALRTQLEKLLAKDVTDFNNVLKERNIPAVKATTGGGNQ
jgi:fumarate hydratase class II